MNSALLFASFMVWFYVIEIEKEWREEDRLGFVVKLRDGRRLLLYY